MQVRLGGEVAVCPQCGAADFVHVEPGTDLTHLSDLLCSTCETPITLAALILQIGDRAMRAARQRLQLRYQQTRRRETFKKLSMVPARGDSRFARSMANTFGIFEGLSKQTVLKVMRRCQAGELPKRTIWVAQGAPAPGVVYLESGLIKLVQRVSGGTDRLFRLVTPGEIFGLEASVLSRDCHYDVIAVSDSRVFIIPAAEISQLLDSNLRFARNVATVFAKSIDELLAERASSTVSPALQRLAGYLSRLAKPQPSNGECVIKLPMHKSALAAHLGIRKETLSRLWRDLTGRNVIESSENQITVLQPERLAQIAAGIGIKEA